MQPNSQRRHCFLGLECLVPVSRSEFTGGSLSAWTTWEGSQNTAWKGLIIPSKYLSPAGSGLSAMCLCGKGHFPSENLDARKNKMEWLGRCWTMEGFPWASLLTLWWSWPSLWHWQLFWNRGHKLSSFQRILNWACQSWQNPSNEMDTQRTACPDTLLARLCRWHSHPWLRRNKNLPLSLLFFLPYLIKAIAS